MNLPDLRDYSVRIFKSYSFKVAQISMLDMVILMLSFCVQVIALNCCKIVRVLKVNCKRSFFLHIQLWTNEKVSSIGLYDFASGYA